MLLLRMHTDLGPLVRALAAIDAEMAQGFSVPLQASAEAISRQWEEAFSAGGPGWARPSPLTLRMRKRSVEGDKALIDTGEGRAGLLATRPGTSTSAYARTESRLTMGTTRIDWPRHQKGGGREPARPLPMLTEALQDEIAGEFVSFTAGTVRRAVGGRG